MAVAQTVGRIEAAPVFGYLHPRRLASVRPRSYFNEPLYGLRVFKVYEVDGTVD